MKLKKMISIFVAMVIVLSIASIPVMADDVAKWHEQKNHINDSLSTKTVDCYTFSGYFPGAYAFGYSFLTSLTNVPLDFSSAVIVDVDYFDGTRDYNNMRSESKTVYEIYDGTQPYVEVAFDETKVVSQITYTHFYYVNGNNIHNRQDVKSFGQGNN